MSLSRIEYECTPARMPVVGNLARMASTHRNQRREWLFVVLVLVIGCQGKDGESEKEYISQYDFKGKVKVARIYTESLPSDSMSLDQSLETVYFNGRGQLVKTEFEKWDQNKGRFRVYKYVNYEYDDDGLLKYRTTYDSLGKLRLKYEVIEYDSNGLPTKDSLLVGDAVSHTLIIYHPSLQIRMSFYEGYLVDKWIKKYKENVIIEEQLIYYENEMDSIVYYKKYDYRKFDRKGNWVERIVNMEHERMVQTEIREIEYF